jgi:two-component system sensor histidine kinase BarA
VIKSKIIMPKKLSHLPIMDKHLGRLFNKNSKQLLRELLEVFIEETPKIQLKINRAHQKREQQKLVDLLHKLHGSCVYCGLLRLKESLIALDYSIKNNNYSDKLLNTVNQEINTALNKAKEIIAG